MLVSAVIPAYNEEKTIAGVIKTLKKISRIDEIIVVSDGSSDQTAWIAHENGTKVIELPENRGKGAAVKAGVGNSCGEVILLLDADLVGLTEHHVYSLLEPVLQGQADMTVGVFQHGRLRTDFAHRVCPYLSGQRAIRRWLFEEISGLEATGYGIEIALTIYSSKNKITINEVELTDIPP